MPTERPLLKPLGAYHSPRDYKEDGYLTRVGRGTPCGEYLRRFWQPVAFVQELSDLPTKVRVLGEDLTLYRGETGRPWLVAGRCAHRRSALHTGWVEGDTIRCMVA